MKPRGLGGHAASRKGGRMPGSFLSSTSEDGGVAFTESSAHSGIFARNNATSPAPPGPGGNAVFGLSTVPNASGVFGANNNGGVGVAGNSEKGVGVLAQSGVVALKAQGPLAGRFEGNVEVTGDIT